MERGVSLLVKESGDVDCVVSSSSLSVTSRLLRYHLLQMMFKHIRLSFFNITEDHFDMTRVHTKLRVLLRLLLASRPPMVSTYDFIRACITLRFLLVY